MVRWYDLPDDLMRHSEWFGSLDNRFGWDGNLGEEDFIEGVF